LVRLQMRSPLRAPLGRTQYRQPAGFKGHAPQSPAIAPGPHEHHPRAEQRSMSRLMSVTLTERAVVERRKTVTRRLGWRMLKVGDRLTLCRKVMGRRKGEPLVRLAEVEVIDVRREPLSAITEPEIDREGVPFLEWDRYRYEPQEPITVSWVRWFCHEMCVDPETEITRIEWRYIGDQVPLFGTSPITRSKT
jgi:hypothetical protein